MHRRLCCRKPCCEERGASADPNLHDAPQCWAMEWTRKVWSWEVSRCTRTYLQWTSLQIMYIYRSILLQIHWLSFSVAEWPALQSGPSPMHPVLVLQTAVRQNRQASRSFSTDLINITAHSVDQRWCRCVGVKRVWSGKVNCHVQDIVGNSLKH